ncbi:uncharacterized mitochondrial protein-like protein [Tanacetum coccineum]
MRHNKKKGILTMMKSLPLRIQSRKGSLWTASNPRAWYETLSTYLLDNGFQRGKIDKTLFIKRDKGDILLVQVYVDDIIFGSTKKSLCTEFEKMMHKKFQMSSMGELTFFLGLQVKQKEDGIFISQDKYVTEILKKFGFTDVKTASTPMETQKPLLKDEDGEEVDVHLYRSMIGSLMYLTFSRPDIMFVVCACARYQINPKMSHLHVVKRIFRYLKGQPKLGLWYPKDSPFDLVAYTDSDYARASLDRKYTTVGCQFLGCRLISWQCKKQIVVANSMTEAEYVASSSYCGQVLWIQNQLLVYGSAEVAIRVEGFELCTIARGGQGENEVTHTHTSDHAMLNEKSNPYLTEATVRRDLQLEDANGSSVPSDPTNIVDEAVTKEPSMQLKELMDFCSKLQQRVLDLENTKTAQAKEITSLKKRVNRFREERSPELTSLKNYPRIGQDMPVHRSARPKTKGVVIQEASESITTTTIIPSKDKGKGIMVEEPSKMKKKDQISFDEQEAIRLHAEFDEDARLAREKDEANVALIKEWNDIQAKIEADQLLAERLQAREQEELTIEERAKLFQQLLEKRRKFFATKRAKEKRNKPPTKTQQRSIMTTYLKNMKAVRQEKKKVQKEHVMSYNTQIFIPDKEEVAVDAIPLANKPPSIVDWKILKDGKIGYYQIIRANGKFKSTPSLIQDA